MKRLIMDELIKWKNRRNRKPLILKGVRQCGKTYILEEFGRRHYKEIAYFNFEGTPALAERFEQDLEPERIISELGVINGKKIEAESTLIIFDEIHRPEKMVRTSMQNLRIDDNLIKIPLYMIWTLDKYLFILNKPFNPY